MEKSQLTACGPIVVISKDMQTGFELPLGESSTARQKQSTITFTTVILPDDGKRQSRQIRR